MKASEMKFVGYRSHGTGRDEAITAEFARTVELNKQQVETQAAYYDIPVNVREDVLKNWPVPPALRPHATKVEDLVGKTFDRVYKRLASNRAVVFHREGGPSYVMEGVGHFQIVRVIGLLEDLAGIGIISVCEAGEENYENDDGQLVRFLEFTFSVPCRAASIKWMAIEDGDCATPGEVRFTCHPAGL